MKFEKSLRGGLLLVRIAEKALVRSPDWDSLGALEQPDIALVALDLREAEFVSSLFWQGCVELSRRLAAAGKQLVLLHVSDYQERLLELCEDTVRLLVLASEEELDDFARSLTSSQAVEEGVTGTEKNMLWS